MLPFEIATIALRASGMLLFAAAGNDDKNVDAEAKDPVFGFGLGFESTWHTPCENAGVICVGGVAPNSLSRDGDSNFGAEQVDLFAPYTLWLGPDPDAPANVVRRKSGTSFSSPFAAGVAALVWAADLDQSASDVEDALLSTTRRRAPTTRSAASSTPWARCAPSWGTSPRPSTSCARAPATNST